MAVAQALASGQIAVAQATLVPSISPANGRGSATMLTTHGFTTKAFPPNKTCRVRRSCSNYNIRAVNAPTDGDISGDNKIKGEQEGSLLERRQILAAGVAGFSLLNPTTVWGATSVKPDPVRGPDLKTCHDAVATSPVTGISYPGLKCCPPNLNATPVKFKFPTGNAPLRIRQPAHMVNQAYIDKYNKAYALMRALPDSDPRSLLQQQKVHCAYCNGAYYQAGTTNTPLQIHFSWLFFPWHRWYLYFHEKILGSLINDPTFALPFWNWDSTHTTASYMMPALFTNSKAAAYDVNRDPSHLPPALVDLNLADLGSTPKTPQYIKEQNLTLLHNQVAKPLTSTSFMGGAYEFGSPNPTGSIGGTLENGAHTTVHGWTGNPSNTYGQDMGNFASSGLDPIFYSHHSNVDRLWDVWRSLPSKRGERQNPTDPDFLLAKFVFYDEKANLVQVQVKDALDSSKLGYGYTPETVSDNEWYNYSPPATTTATASSDSGSLVFVSSTTVSEELGPASGNTEGVKIKTPYKSLVARVDPPAELLKKYSVDQLEEVLVLQNVRLPADLAIHFDVFVNLPEADETTPINIAEYVGSFHNLPHFMNMVPSESMQRDTNVRLPISENLAKIGLKDKSKIVVTVVPKGTDEQKDFSIKGIIMEYE